MLSYETILNAKVELKNQFKRELSSLDDVNFGTIIRINRSIIRDIALFLHENAGAYFINLFIIDSGDKFDLTYEFFIRFNTGKKFWYVSTEVDKQANEIDSIEIIYPNARFYETEISKRYGINFLVFTEVLNEEIFVKPTPLVPEGMESSKVPIGIYNKIHHDNYYFHLELVKNSNQIKGVSQKTGWLYRGIIPLLQEKNALTENVQLTKRITGINAFHHSLAYIMGIEGLFELEINERISLIRTLICELERVESHLVFLASLLYLLRFSRESNALLKLRMDLKSTYQKLFKTQILSDTNFIGSIQDINQKDLNQCKTQILDVLSTIYDSASYYLYKKHLVEKCCGIGILHKEDAPESGLTGPCLRASNINLDLRAEEPYLSYLTKEVAQSWNVVTCQEGDAFSRIHARVKEIDNSNKIIAVLLELIGNNAMEVPKIEIEKLRLPVNKTWISKVESPQGELSYYFKTKSNQKEMTLSGLYICTPSLKNFTALNKYILLDNDLKNLALMVHSMDLIWNEIDL